MMALLGNPRILFDFVNDYNNIYHVPEIHREFSATPMASTLEQSPGDPTVIASTVRHRNGIQSESLGISAAEAAALLGVSESHFYCLHKTGRLGPLPVRMGRAVRWSRQELVNWFNAGSPPRSRWQANGKGLRSP